MQTIKKPALTESQLAERWGMSIKTLQDWRRKGTGIAYLKLGKAIRYPLDVVEAYEKANMNEVGQ